MRIMTIMATTLLATGCATSKTVHLPDGSVGHTIECGGAALSWNLCYEKAGELCGTKGYNVISAQGESNPTMGGSESGFMAGSVVQRSMMIQCKK